MHGETVRNAGVDDLPLFGARRVVVDASTEALAGLRPYQVDAYHGIVRELGGCRSTLVVMATGLGKTTVFGAIAKGWKGRVLVLAHRSELIDQAARRLRQMTGEPVDVEQADAWAAGARIVVGTVQTLQAAKRLERFGRAPFDLVIVDEAHHAAADSYGKILDAFPAAKVLGVTATPDRGDGEALGKVFETVAYRRDIEDGIADGYLAPVLPRRVVLEGVDLSRVKTTAGDLNMGQLDAEMQKGNEAVAQGLLELVGARKTVVFSTKVETAHDLAATINARTKSEVAIAVDGKTDFDKRRAIMGGFERGQWQFLVNVGIATEGWDCWDVAAVAIARPTKSRALYAQMAGRGLRVQPGIDRAPSAAERLAGIAASSKPDCMLIDFSGNAGRHALVCPLDILGGKWSEEEVAAAWEITEKKGATGNDALKEARQRLADERRRREEEIRAHEARVRQRVGTFDPFNAYGVEDAAPRAGDKAPPIRPDQARTLQSFGLKPRDIERLNVRQASALIKEGIERRRRGLCTLPQLRVLRDKGIDGAAVTFLQARALIDAIAANGWKPPPRHVVDGIMRGSERQPGEEG